MENKNNSIKKTCINNKIKSKKIEKVKNHIENEDNK